MRPRSNTRGVRVPSRVVDAVLRSNVTAIRNVIRQSMVRDAVKLHASTRLTQATRILEALHNEELTCIAETALGIERLTRDAKLSELPVLITGALRSLHQRTSEEPIDFTYNQRFGNYP
jgi:hypothetical protein